MNRGSCVFDHLEPKPIRVCQSLHIVSTRIVGAKVGGAFAPCWGSRWLTVYHKGAVLSIAEPSGLRFIFRVHQLIHQSVDGFVFGRWGVDGLVDAVDGDARSAEVIEELGVLWLYDNQSSE